jgi:hypothetical protein
MWMSKFRSLGAVMWTRISFRKEFVKLPREKSSGMKKIGGQT